MGLPHSGDVAGSAFLVAVEQPFATSPAAQYSHGIKTWLRYHDDIFGIATSAPLFRRFFDSVQRLAAPRHTLNLEEVSRDAVTMIGMKIQNTNGCLSLHVVTRDLAAPVLDFSSAHPSSIHRRWPAARARAISRLCATRSDNAMRVNEHRQRFILSCAPGFVISDIDARDDPKPVSSAVSSKDFACFLYHPAHVLATLLEL